jgi:hypothetical protein
MNTFSVYTGMWDLRIHDFFFLSNGTEDGYIWLFFSLLVMKHIYICVCVSVYIYICVCVYIYIFFFFCWLYWVLNSRPTLLLGRHSITWSTPLAFFCIRYFWDRVSPLFDPADFTIIFLISASWAARITSVNHWRLSSHETCELRYIPVFWIFFDMYKC